MNIVGRKEHVDAKARPIRTTKKRAKCIRHTLPYKYYTNWITEEMILDTTKMLNVFPNKEDIDKDLSTDVITLGILRID